MMGRRFVVLDRDGTVIVERHYLSDPGQVELLSGAGSGLRRLAELGLGLVLVTNQSAIGRGFFDQPRLKLVHSRLRELLEAERVRLDGIYFCPHTPADECACRKPRPGMIETAAEELDFDLRRCFVVGDNECDVALGRHVGATTILVRTGYGAQVAAEGKVDPDYVVDDLDEAALVIERLVGVGERV
jgi:D-glycero-D-manno-heptose 1,7-bisphosphate phosphatase